MEHPELSKDFGTANVKLIKIGSILGYISDLESQLMQTFTLLMSSLSVKDSHTSLQQARRGTLVTALAFIYVSKPKAPKLYAVIV